MKEPQMNPSNDELGKRNALSRTLRPKPFASFRSWSVVTRVINDYNQLPAQSTSSHERQGTDSKIAALGDCDNRGQRAQVRMPGAVGKSQASYGAVEEGRRAVILETPS